MGNDAYDITDTLVAKSDQLNADDLMAGPITVQITGATKVEGEQPVTVKISGGHQPWKPCKTMRRVLAKAWTADCRTWNGRWLLLYRDPTAKFGGVEVGGIRIKAMSDIPGAIEVNLNSSRGKKTMWKIDRLSPPAGTGQAPSSNGAAKPPPPAIDQFRKAVREKLDLDPDAVIAWAKASDLDITTMAPADLQALFARIKVDGADRANLDAFLAPPNANEPPAGEPDGAGLF